MKICMNNLKNIFLFFLAGGTLLAACTKKLNTNLNDPNGLGINAVTGKDVFAQALNATVTNKIGTCISSFPSDNYDYAQEWMGYWSRNSGYSASGVGAHVEAYALIYSDANGVWQSLYHNIYDYNYVMSNSSAGSILPGASRVVRAMIFEDLVDQFGNIPYSQAAQPNVSITPAYDSAATIYKGLVAQIDSAITEITASQSTADDASDIMFKGNKSLWLAFANTLKLRMLLRQVPNVFSPTDPYITGELSNVASQGGFLGAGQDALINPGYTDASEQQNPFWGDYGYEPGSTSGYQNFNYFGANTVVLDSLQSTGDPRIGYFFNQVSGGGYLGNPLGEPIVGASQFGKGWLQSPSAPALLFSASQSFFMQAEAAQRGMMSGSVASLFQSGVEESFRYLGLTQSAADTWIAGSTDPGVNIAVSGNALATILNQKWVAECGLDGLEAYSDYRRTGLPALYSVNSSLVPQQRLLYPETEYTLNSANVNAQNEASQSATAIPLFWAK
jgi:hypothetical protein